MTDSELVIVRGSTPLLVMTVPDKITLSDIADGTITISQKRSGVKIIKKLSEMTFDERNRAYSVFLTQAETLSLDSAWLASIQAKLCDNADVVLVSFMYDVEVLQVNNENILSLDQPSGTAYETPFEGKGIDFLPDLINFQPKIDLESVITSGDYEQLINKPSIGGVTLIGDLSLSDLGAYTKSEIDSTVEEINQKDSDQDTRMNGIDTRIDGVDASIDALDTRADGIDTRIDGVDTRLNNQIGNYVVSRNVESNEYSNSQIDTFFNGFAREIDDLENRIDDQIGLHTLARNVLADEYSNSEIDSKVSAVQGDVDSLETKVNTQLGNYTVSRNVAADEYTNTEIDSALAGKVNTEAGKGLSTNDYTTAEKTKLGDLPTSSELNTALNGKVDKITGKGLSTEDYTTDEKSKLSGIETGAQVNKVETVNSIQPDSNKNVALTAEDIPADGIGDKTVSGNPITVTDALESIAKDLQVEFGPIQEGTPWVGTDTDKAPYNFRAVSDSVVSELGNREHDKLVGGTVAWNQLARTIWGIQGGTINSVTDGVYDVSFSNSGVNCQLYSSISTVSNHVHIATVMLKIPNTVNEIIYSGGSNGSYNRNALTTDWQKIVNVWKGSAYNYNLLRNNSGGAVEHVLVKEPQVFDLTAMFGSTIADYIYSLEQATAGAGVAWFRKLFPAPYYPYNAGQLMSVKTSAHVTMGFNQWDEEYTFTGINAITGVIGTWTDRITSKNYIPVLENTSYYLRSSAPSGTSFFVHCYDEDKTWLGTISGNGYITGSGLFTTLPNTAYIKFASASGLYGTTYNHDICINISKTTGTPKNGDYVPYDGHTYTLDPDLELRGIPKLENNKLVYDGDIYEASGNVQRKYGIVDMGTLTWTYSNGVFTTVIDDGKPVTTQGASPIFIQAKYTQKNSASSQAYTDEDKVIWNGYTNGNACYVRVKDSAYSDATAFATAMSGVYLVYELATPTTETADPYTSSQVIDPDGTEEYVDSRTVAIPVGHESNYANICPISGRTGTAVTRSDGTETDPDTDTASVSFGQTVYGGQVDFVTGKVRVTYGIVDLGTLAWIISPSPKGKFYAPNVPAYAIGNVKMVCEYYEYTGTADSSPYYGENGTIQAFLRGGSLAGTEIYVHDERFTDVATFKTAMNGVQLCYELESPIELDLTPAQLTLLQGTNILTADGTINLTYLGSEASNVQDEINEFESGLNNVIGSIAFIENSTAKTSHAVGEYIILNGIFCKVISAISSGETLSFGTNIQATTIGAELRAIWAQIQA